MLESRVADPHHFNADLDTDKAFISNEDLDSAFHFNADANPALFKVMSLRLYFESLNLLNFDLKANPDPTFHSDADTDLQSW